MTRKTRPDQFLAPYRRLFLPPGDALLYVCLRCFIVNWLKLALDSRREARLVSGHERTGDCPVREAQEAKALLRRLGKCAGTVTEVPWASRASMSRCHYQHQREAYESRQVNHLG